ncbi:peptidoglycan D,D-transpeptidase FtsI family protein [Propioniciclava soli]|uniref:peptidoglycan D,D-transpeptidase FtsI family protein n=1 Tax=Propioniciclava soli TaxID=2775081 RepID=UPI001E4AAEC4
MTQSRPTPRRTAPRPGRVPLASSAFRLRTMALLVAIMFSVVGARAVQIQVLSASAMAQEAASKMTRTRDVPAQRGEITDRNGNVLAFTEDTVNVIADPTMIATNGKEPEAMRESDRARAAVAPTEMAAIIAAHTGGDAAEIEAKLRQSTTTNATGEEVPLRYTLLARQIPSSTWVDLLAELNAGDYVGVFREANPRRTYPMGTLASNVIGSMSEGKGLMGLEYARQDALAGTPGRESYETSPNGRIPLGNQQLTPAVDGDDLQLTLDSDLQWMVEQRLAARVDEVGGNWGAALVMDAESGELLALANYPSFDSNNPGAANSADTGNRAVEATYEPGSVQKVLTLASLLDAGLTTPDTAYHIGKDVQVGDHHVTDAFRHDDIDITTRGILVKSSNVGAITAARSMDPDVLRDYMLKFGLGQPTTLGLPGEASGSVPPVGMPSYQADSMAFGYGLSVSSVQMAAAVASLANDGVYTAPSIIAGTTDTHGTYTPAAEPATHRVVSEQAAREVVAMMEQRTIANDDQIGIPGYRTGAKTGSARISTGAGYSGQVASIIGVAPVEDPQIVVYVLIARPDTQGAGLGMAGPVYRDIMSLALPRFGVRPSEDVPTEQLPLIVGE